LSNKFNLIKKTFFKKKLNLTNNNKLNDQR
jgi:hypothetical protein